MKNLFELTDKEIEKYRNKPFKVYEKLDMIYFKVNVSADGWYITNSKGRKIDNIDVIVNSVYGNIMNFASEVSNGLFEAFGEIRVGFFYLPVHKTRTIEYEMAENSFILSDYHTYDKSRRDDNKLVSILSNSISIGDKNVFFKGNFGKIGPYIGEITLGDWFYKDMDAMSFVNRMMEQMGVHNTFSTNGTAYIEGLVLRDGTKAYEVIVNDTKFFIEPSSKLIYRDTFLESFIHTVQKGTRERILLSEKDYVGKICDLFIEYVNSTDFFNTMWFEEEDLLPPIEGYIGDVTYSMLPPIVSIICRKNPVYKNALRTLLVTFNSPVYSNKFKRFKQEEKAVLTEILVKSHLSEKADK